MSTVNNRYYIEPTQRAQSLDKSPNIDHLKVKTGFTDSLVVFTAEVYKLVRVENGWVAGRVKCMPGFSLMIGMAIACFVERRTIWQSGEEALISLTSKPSWLYLLDEH